MQRIDQETAAAELSWLKAMDPGGTVAGFDARGWPDETWILHAMYFNADMPDMTNAEAHQHGLVAGWIGPTILGGVDPDGATTVTGIGLGFDPAPGAPWTRLRWHESQATLDSQAIPPSHGWFRFPWPMSIDGPNEGSLNDDDFRALLDRLALTAAEGGDIDCFAYYAAMPAGMDFDTIHLWRGPLKELPTLLRDPIPFDVADCVYKYTPTNIWPVDRSWFVWTDYDLLGTRVSGSTELVDAIRQDAQLETLDWRRPAGTD